MCRYIDDIKTALEAIPACYVIESNNSNRLAERVFAYEFYHRFRLLMHSDKSTYKGLYLAGEQSKVYAKRHCNRTNDAPDIVLSGNISIPEKQVLLIEIKMKGNRQWKKDLEKMTEFSESDLKFDKHCFIYVGESFDNLRKKIKKTRNSKKLNGEIIIFNCEVVDNEIYVEKNLLSDLII